MAQDEPRDIESTRSRWNRHAETYDQWYKTFEGAVENYVDWKLLKEHLPKNRDAKILDAAGGTGRITLPLAKMGYLVTLCDISPGMLDVAKRKIFKEAVSDKVRISECNVCSLPFPDETFDFVLCWDGTVEATNELIRVTKKGGKISIFLVNRWGAAIGKFREDPDSGLALVRSESSYVYDDQEKYMAVGVDQARELFEKKGIRVIELCAVCGWLGVLSISEELRKSRNWDEKFFGQTTEMVLALSKEPSIKGVSRHLVLYGERI